jgi:sortase (surface protein transpeptidase)
MKKKVKIIAAVAAAVLVLGGGFTIAKAMNKSKIAKKDKDKTTNKLVSNQQSLPLGLDKDTLGFWDAITTTSGFDLGYPYWDSITETEGSYPFKQTQDLEYRVISASFSQKDKVAKRVSDIKGIEQTETKFKIEIPTAKIEAPIKYAKYDQYYEKNDDGTLNLQKAIIEDRALVEAGNPLTTPIQNLLTEGVVRVPTSAFPGELGNSYIVGHSSNFTSVKSDYNFVFKDLEKVNNGDIFYVYDHTGRKLPFKVFEEIVIKEEDVATAYKPFADKRVVTLQGSVLEKIDGKMKPTKRLLVRGELVTPAQQ